MQNPSINIKYEKLCCFFYNPLYFVYHWEWFQLRIVRRWEAIDSTSSYFQKCITLCCSFNVKDWNIQYLKILKILNLIALNPTKIVALFETVRWLLAYQLPAFTTSVLHNYKGDLFIGVRWTGFYIDFSRRTPSNQCCIFTIYNLFLFLQWISLHFLWCQMKLCFTKYTT